MYSEVVGVKSDMGGSKTTGEERGTILSPPKTSRGFYERFCALLDDRKGGAGDGAVSQGKWILRIV